MKQSPGEALERILRNLNECNAIQYVAYRTASKIFTLQKAFYCKSFYLLKLKSYQFTNT